MSQQPLPPSAPASSPPIAKLLPILSTTFSVVLSLALSFFSTVSTPLLSILSIITLSSPLPGILLYILSPLLALLSLAQDVLLRKPYAAAAYIFDVFAPVYVFCGVAIIVGCLIGFGGRVVSIVLIDWILAQVAMMRDDRRSRKRSL